jgi:hypothetical protein
MVGFLMAGFRTADGGRETADGGRETIGGATTEADGSGMVGRLIAGFGSGTSLIDSVGPGIIGPDIAAAPTGSGLAASENLTVGFGPASEKVTVGFGPASENVTVGFVRALNELKAPTLFLTATPFSCTRLTPNPEAPNPGAPVSPILYIATQKSVPVVPARAGMLPAPRPSYYVPSPL